MPLWGTQVTACIPHQLAAHQILFFKVQLVGIFQDTPKKDAHSLTQPARGAPWPQGGWEPQSGEEGLSLWGRKLSPSAVPGSSCCFAGQ